MDATAVGVARKEDQEEGIDEQTFNVYGATNREKLSEQCSYGVIGKKHYMECTTIIRGDTVGL